MSFDTWSGHILLTDSSQSSDFVSRPLHDALCDAGYRVTVVAQPQDALTVLEDERPQVLVFIDGLPTGWHDRLREVDDDVPMVRVGPTSQALEAIQDGWFDQLPLDSPRFLTVIAQASQQFHHLLSVRSPVSYTHLTLPTILLV